VITPLQQLRSTDGADKKRLHVLIFDNHPDSLRLMCGRGADSRVRPSALWPMIASEVVLPCILVVGLIAAMFWPLF
jgi:hypothetical protein